jgi:putative hemolysin
MIWVLVAVLLLCSGTISASETALFALSRQALHQFSRSEGNLGRRVHLVMLHPHRVLMTVLIVNTAVNVSIFAVSFIALRQIAGVSAAVPAVGSLVVLLSVIFFGEIVPKAVAFRSPRRFAPTAAGLISALQFVLGPVRWVLGTFLVEPITRLLAPHPSTADAVTTEELKLLVEHSAREGVIDSTENEMLQAVVALGDVSVREVMTPRVDICSVAIDPPTADRTSVLQTIRRSGRRRLPVRGRDLDDIHGMLYARDLHLNPNVPIKTLIRRVHFVPEQVNLVQLLRHFRSEMIELAIVVDEYGGTAGLVTVEDVVEWIVGDLPDAETPRPAEPAERIDENTYRLPGALSVRDWADRFEVGEVDREVHTLAGLILAKLARLPRAGDTVRIRNLTLTVEAMERRRIQRVLLHRDAEGAPVTEGAS